MFIPQSALPGLHHKVEGQMAPRSACRDCWPIIHATHRGRPRLPQEVREDRRRIGQLLKKLRREKYKTQIECAYAIGLTGPAMIGNLESGNWFNQEVIEKLIAYLEKC